MFFSVIGSSLCNYFGIIIPEMHELNEPFILHCLLLFRVIDNFPFLATMNSFPVKISSGLLAIGTLMGIINGIIAEDN